MPQAGEYAVSLGYWTPCTKKINANISPGLQVPYRERRPQFELVGEQSLNNVT